MDLHIGLNQAIAIGWLLSIIATHFVSAAYGKRIGMKGGTIKDSTTAAIVTLRKAANEKLQADIKAVKEKAKEQI